MGDRRRPTRGTSNVDERRRVAHERIVEDGEGSKAISLEVRRTENQEQRAKIRHLLERPDLSVDYRRILVECWLPWLEQRDVNTLTTKVAAIVSKTLFIGMLVDKGRMKLEYPLGPRGWTVETEREYQVRRAERVIEGRPAWMNDKTLLPARPPKGNSG